MDLLITQEEIEEFSDNPRERFVQIEQACRTRFYNLIQNEEEWGVIQDARLRYMTAVVAAAKYLKIEPISEIELPRRSNWNDDTFNDFVSDLSYYTMHLMLESADRKNRTAIFLEGPTKDRLRTLTSHLREEVRKLDLPPARIDKLLRQIDGFEKALEARRLTFVAVGLVTLTIAGAIADAGGATSTVRELVNKIEEAVGQAKEEQDRDAASRLVPPDEVRRLVPPRSKEPERTAPSPSDLDDEIPF